MSRVEVQESGEINVHVYSAEGDVHEIKVFKGTHPEDAVVAFSNSSSDDLMSWLEVYQADGNLENE